MTEPAKIANATGCTRQHVVSSTPGSCTRAAFDCDLRGELQVLWRLGGIDPPPANGRYWQCAPNSYLVFDFTATWNHEIASQLRHVLPTLPWVKR